MKNITIIFIVIAATFVSCKSSKYEPPQDTGKMTVTTMKKDVELAIGGYGEAFIDWGDMWAPTRINCRTIVTTSSHSFLTQIPHIINIYGDGVTELICSGNSITDIELEENPWLEILDCSDNDLYSINVSNNTALNCLFCNNNHLTATALNAIFSNLNRSTYHGDRPKIINISNNPGERTCNKRIAEQKGWVFVY